MQAHHVFPQKYTTDFTRRGINIHDPKYGLWWETRSHQMNASAYNTSWAEFFEANADFAQMQALEEGKRIMMRNLTCQQITRLVEYE